MVLSCQRDPYKALWAAALFLCFAETLSAQTRLGLHFTQEELNIWRQRAQNGPYKTNGDVCTNSPGDWERIVSHASVFLSNPSGERWKGQTNAVCVKPYDPIAPNSHPYPANPSTGGWSGWTGCCGIYPGVLFMFGQMEGKVWPYPRATPGEGSVQKGATNLNKEK